MIKFLKTYSKDIISIFCLILTGLWVLKGFQDRVDINLTDDSGYLVLGLRIAQGALAGFGPLYSIMFKVLKQFTDDPVRIYDTAMYLMYLLPPVAAYLFLRAMGLRLVSSLLLCTAWMLSPNIMSFITWSKISHYTIMIVFLWAFIAVRWKSTIGILFSLFTLTFFLGYIRPESHLSWYISTIILLGYWAVNEKFHFSKKWWRFVLPAMVLICFFFFIIGNPMAGGRSNIAFAQQFSYNYCEWNGLNHFDWIQWRDIAHQNFGDFNTLGEAFKNNPSLFIKHLTYNFQQYIIKFIQALTFAFFPPSVFKGSSWMYSGILLIIFIIKIGYVGFGNWWGQVKNLLVRHAWIGIGLLIIGVPSVIASMVFYTREHYLLLMMPFVFFMLAIFFLPHKSEKDTTPRIVNTGLWIVAIIIIFMFKPNLSDYRTFDVWEEYSYPSNRKTIEAIRSMGFQQEIREVDYEGGLATYLGKNFKWANPFNKESEPYSEFVEKQQPNFYYVTKALLSNRFLNQDPEFMDIIQNPKKYGFHKITLQNQNKGYLLVQDSLRYTPTKN